MRPVNGIPFSCAPVGRFCNLLVAAALLILLGVPFAGAAGLKADESAIVFPTSAHKEDGHWLIPLHGWLFELEEDSWWRSTLMDVLLESLGASQETITQEPFRSRARMFLVDNERGKQLALTIGGQQVTTPPSGANGHFSTTLRLAPESAVGKSGQWLGVSIDTGNSGANVTDGRVQLLAERGVSVISDIDDTIKHSEVLDKSALLANTFLHPFNPVPGMASVYRKWAEAGAGFHYVSASPWQLYPALSEFMQDTGFPAGSVHLKTFRLKDGTVKNLFASSDKTKPPVLRSLLRRFPQRQFVLVGDSGERDAEIYASLAREFPGQVTAIYIRKIDDNDVSSHRLRAAFTGLPKSRWMLFTHASELPNRITTR